MNIIKVPYSQGSLGKNQGTELAPDAIVKELENIYLNENYNGFSFSIVEIKTDSQNIENNFQLISSSAGEDGIYFGGDHSITYPLFKAFASRYQNPGLIIFDAHPDCMPSEFTHEDIVSNIIQNKLTLPQNIILVGIRNSSIEEVNFINRHKIKVFDMKRIYNNVQDVCDTIMENMRNCPAFYISIDIDVLDPAFAPGTGYIEPGGLTTRELLYFIQRLKLLKNFRCADIVEVNPEKDINQITIKTVAKILGELL